MEEIVEEKHKIIKEEWAIPDIEEEVEEIEIAGTEEK